MTTQYASDLAKRLAAAEEWAHRIQRERPDDHKTIAQAWAHVRRLKTAVKEAAK